ncbi:hypothetical protein P691DRAFT_782294 [Macrolepiota fuliginosa MF-IS2]|uniref:Uncharacterized protein n=1 Tax=Macrolepiota fuliginosa MF-IS2 TaxID=1400762 RepID=A0A9P5XAM3_9AGAR|nr:hypothetical protein P691DRAFT_782294 [Macrolepiota fuliginosa MF-IS2]
MSRRRQTLSKMVEANRRRPEKLYENPARVLRPKHRKYAHYQGILSVLLVPCTADALKFEIRPYDTNTAPEHLGRRQHGGCGTNHFSNHKILPSPLCSRPHMLFEVGIACFATALEVSFESKIETDAYDSKEWNDSWDEWPWWMDRRRAASLDDNGREFRPRKHEVLVHDDQSLGVTPKTTLAVISAGMLRKFSQSLPPLPACHFFTKDSTTDRITTEYADQTYYIRLTAVQSGANHSRSCPIVILLTPAQFFWAAGIAVPPETNITQMY